MATPQTPGPQADIEVYQFYVGLCEVTPAVWRRLLVRADSTIYDLHYIFQLAFGWSDSHLNRFLINGKEYGVYKIGGRLFWDDPLELKLADLQLRSKQRFIYEYDFYDHWLHEIRLENKLPLEPKKIYPRCVAGKGKTPPEDCGGVQAYLKQLTYNSPFYLDDRLDTILAEVLVSLNEGNIREVYSYYEEEVAHIKRWIDQHNNLFERELINKRLQQFSLREEGWWEGLG